MAEKQLYASHYFETALDLSFCVRDEANPAAAFYLITLMGSEQDGLTGPKGAIVRKVAVGRSVSNLQDGLTSIRDSIERGPRYYPASSNHAPNSSLSEPLSRCEITPVALVVLDALFAEKNVTHAGERIHLSQSATSGALSRFREYFKDDLLVPVGRKMVLTPLAEELAQPVRELLQQAGSRHPADAGILAEIVGADSASSCPTGRNRLPRSVQKNRSDYLPGSGPPSDE